MIENSTAFPRGSFKISPSRWNPAVASNRLAAAGSNGSGLSAVLNHNLFAGDTGPAADLARYLFIFANLLVAIIAIGTIWLVARGRLNLKWTGQ